MLTLLAWLSFDALLTNEVSAPSTGVLRLRRRTLLAFERREARRTAALMRAPGRSGCGCSGGTSSPRRSLRGGGGVGDALGCVRCRLFAACCSMSSTCRFCCASSVSSGAVNELRRREELRIDAFLTFILGRRVGRFGTLTAQVLDSAFASACAFASAFAWAFASDLAPALASTLASAFASTFVPALPIAQASVVALNLASGVDGCQSRACELRLNSALASTQDSSVVAGRGLAAGLGITGADVIEARLWRPDTADNGARPEVDKGDERAE